MSECLALLLLEDSADDAELIRRELLRAGYDPQIIRVDADEDLRQALAENTFDLAISDFAVPGLQTPDAIAAVVASDPELPVILVSGTIGEEAAAACFRAGARDFVAKDRLAGLRRAVPQALREADLRRQSRAAGEALRRSEERFVLLARSSRDIAWDYDVAADDLWSSEQTVDVLGYASGTFPRTLDDYAAIVHPEDRAAFLQSVHDALAHRERRWSAEYRLLRADGTVAHVLDRGFIMYDGGAPTRVIGSTLDLSHRIEAEQALRERTEELSSRVRELRCLYLISGMLARADDGWDHALQEVAGTVAGALPAGSAVAITLGGITGGSPGFDDDRITESVRLPVEGQSDGRMKVCLPGGPGDLPAVRGFLEAVGDRLVETERRRQAEESLRQSEARYRSVIEQSSDIISIIDEQGIIRYESPSLLRVLGYPPEGLVGTSAFHLVHPEDASNVLKAFKEGALKLGSVATVGYRARHANGSWRTLESSATNLLADPHVQGILVVSRDITERMELEAQLLQSRKMEAIGRLAGGVAHDFNNLLTAIAGHAAFLCDELAPEDPRQDEAVQIARMAERAAGLTRQLLAFSRKQILQPQAVELNRGIEEVLTMLERLIGEDITIVPELEAACGYVRVDPGQFQQVLLNVCLNARDAMPAGGRLVVRTRCVSISPEDAARYRGAAPGRYSCIEVQDNGAGMTPDVLAHIFEPFFTTKPQGRGTGLGLPTVYGIVTQSDGFVDVESEPGLGTLFRIFIPCVAAPPAELPSEPHGEHATGAARLPRPAASRTILLVEDEPAVRSMAERVLRRAGHEVISAGDAESALLTAAQFEGVIALLVTDVVLPGMSGAELGRQLSAARPGVQVLFTSGYTEDEIIRRGVQESGLSFLEKPFTPRQLEEKVATLLE